MVQTATILAYGVIDGKDGSDGKDGKDGAQGKQGEQGDPGYSVSVTPTDIIFTQSMTKSSGQYPLVEATKTARVTCKKGGVAASHTTAVTSYSGCQSATADGDTITIVGKIGSYEEGEVNVRVTVDGGSAFDFRIILHYNLNGTWRETVEAGARTVAAEQTRAEIENGNLVKNDSAYKALQDAVQSHEQWKSSRESVYDGYASQISATNTRIDNANQSIQTLESTVGGHTESISEIRQTAQSIHIGVTDGWQNLITDPYSTEGTKGVADSFATVTDDYMGKVLEISKSTVGDWQLRHKIADNYADLNGRDVTWFCIVKCTGDGDQDPGNGSLNFGSGYYTASNNFKAVRMTASAKVVSVSSPLSTSYFSGIESGCTAIDGEKGWYLCWVSAELKFPNWFTIIYNQSYDSYTVGFNEMVGTWRIWYCGIVRGRGCPPVNIIQQRSGMSRAGIDITKGKIVLDAENVVATGNFYVPRVISSNEDMTTTVEAGQVRIQSRRNQSYGLFALNSSGEIVLQMYDKNGKCVLNLGGSPDTVVHGYWKELPMKKIADYGASYTASRALMTAMAADCTTFQELHLGTLQNTGATMKYFTPGGTETTNATTIARDSHVFTSKSDTDTGINALTFIPDGKYVRRNDGVFMETFSPTAETTGQYVCTVYTYRNGMIESTEDALFLT